MNTLSYRNSRMQLWLTAPARTRDRDLSGVRAPPSKSSFDSSNEHPMRSSSRSSAPSATSITCWWTPSVSVGSVWPTGHTARRGLTVRRDAGVPALLVTHDFTEAALLGDHVGVIDGGRVIQHGTAAQLAAEPASAFVADFTGAVVL